MKHFKEIIVALLVLVVLLLGTLVVILLCDMNSDKKMKYYDESIKDGYYKYEKDIVTHRDNRKLYESEMKYDSDKAQQTMALVERAIRDYNTNKEDALSGIRDGVYVHDDLYVFSVMGEYTVGHPYRKDLENTKITERKDVNGYYYGKDIITATEDGKWVDYVFTVPTTNEHVPKSTYCKKVDTHILCAGYYHMN